MSYTLRSSPLASRLGFHPLPSPPSFHHSVRLGPRRTLQPFRQRAHNSQGPYPWRSPTPPPSHDASRRSPNARAGVWLLVGLNTAGFAAWQYAKHTQDARVGQFLVDYGTVSYAGVKNGNYAPLVTAAFSHLAPLHFAVNAWSLYLFGGLLAAHPGLGFAHILSLCLGAAVAGNAAYVYDASQKAPRAAARPALGASGVVMGFGTALSLLAPHVKLYVFPLPVPLPIWVVVGGFTLVDAYLKDSAASRVGHAAHLGGALAGAVYYAVYLRRFGGVWPMLARLVRR
ncbi:hypothetical protein B0A49_07926 [Cryomyces minteri]|uniref:Peptidase S54 rhomboid domain-containing protein n=1 Tax=Cryomyces minteri TaxID=331657 RepID=A0A4U0WWC5_9PEZI|nr:hypothetical protein B0A49_07926 [Cryomyces minteri]